MAAQRDARRHREGTGTVRLGDRQLAAWEAIARGWKMEIDGRVVRCMACGRGIRLLKDVTGRMYLFGEDEVLALTVLHLRNHHPGLDPDKPAQTL